MAEQVSLNELRGKTLRVIVAEALTDELILEDEFGAEYSVEISPHGYDPYLALYRR